MPNYKDQPTPEEQRIAQELDELYPKAKSKTVVDYKGKIYQIRYFPMAETAKGEKVKEWGHRWIPIK
jgi:predicted Mrr-cat superfamily restriction endonuclease